VNVELINKKETTYLWILEMLVNPVLHII